MQLLRPTAAGQVVALHGQAVARAADGRLRLLAVGDWVASDEVIVAAQNGFVQLATDEQPAVRLAALGAGAALAAARAGGVGTAPTVVPSDLPAAEALRSESASPLTPSLRIAAADAPGPRAEAFEGTAAGASAAVGASAAEAVAAPALLPVPSGRTPGLDRLPPWAFSRQLAGTEDTPLPIALSGRDPDGRIAQVWIVKVPTGGVLYQADGVPIADRTPVSAAAAATLVFHPSPDFHGNPGVLQYFVVDGSGKASAVQTVTIDIASVNDLPRPGTVPLGPDGLAIDDPSPAHVHGTPDYLHRTATGTPVAGVIAATDVDGDTLSFRTDVAPAHGELRHGTDGSFVYTPVAVFQGTDRFVVVVDDGHGGQATSTVRVEVGLAGGATPQAVAAPAIVEGGLDGTTLHVAAAGAVAVGASASASVASSASATLALDPRDLLSADGWPLLGPGGGHAPAATGGDALRAGLALDLGFGPGLDGAARPLLPPFWTSTTNDP